MKYSLPFNKGNKKNMFCITTSIQPITAHPSYCNQARNRNKSYEDQKRRNKTTINSDDLLVYIKLRKNLHTIEINEFSKIAGYNVNTQKSVVFYYTSKRLENEIKSIPILKKNSPF